MKKEEVEKYKEEVINKLDESFKSKALEMFENAKNGKVKEHVEKLSYRKVDADEAQRLNDKIGLDLNGYEHNITNTDVIHIYKEHGNEKTEAFMGQRAVTSKDILLIPEITKNYDDVILSPRTPKTSQNKVIIYRKQIGDEFVYLETIGGKKNRELRSKSLRIVKNKN